jgi:hypothetical protein
MVHSILLTLFQHEGLTYLSFSIIVIIIAIFLSHRTKEYQPYKPRARWKKRLEKTVSACYTTARNILKRKVTHVKIHLPFLPCNRRRKKYYIYYQGSRKITHYKKSSRMRLIRNMAWLYTATTSVATALPASERRTVLPCLRHGARHSTLYVRASNTYWP